MYFKCKCVSLSLSMWPPIAYNLTGWRILDFKKSLDFSFVFLSLFVRPQDPSFEQSGKTARSDLNLCSPPNTNFLPVTHTLAQTTRILKPKAKCNWLEVGPGGVLPRKLIKFEWILTQLCRLETAQLIHHSNFISQQSIQYCNEIR